MVHVTSNLHVSAGLPRRESANAVQPVVNFHACVTSAARVKFYAEVGTIYTLVATATCSH